MCVVRVKSKASLVRVLGLCVIGEGPRQGLGV